MNGEGQDVVVVTDTDSLAFVREFLSRYRVAEIASQGLKQASLAAVEG